MLPYYLTYILIEVSSLTKPKLNYYAHLYTRTNVCVFCLTVLYALQYYPYCPTNAAT